MGEHPKETTRLFDEVQALRAEVENVQGLLQGYLGREALLSEMMEQMAGHFNGTKGLFEQLHTEFANHADGALGQHAQQRQAMGDPVQDAQSELARINEILSKPAVPPPEMPLHLHQVVKQGGRMV